MVTIDLSTQPLPECFQHVCKFHSRFLEKEGGKPGKLDVSYILPNLGNYIVEVMASSSASDVDADTPSEPCSKPFQFAVPDMPLGVSSLCSGSGCGELTFHELSRALSCPSSYVGFAAENVPWKQRFLIDNILGSDPEACLFDCCNTLAAGQGKCVRHVGQECSINKRRTRILKSGFSCKSFSKYNSAFSQNQTAMQRQDQACTSVRTFKSTAICIALTQPAVFVLENVDSIGDAAIDNSNLSLVLSDLKEVDNGSYNVRVFRLNSDCYLLPQNRLLRSGLVLF